uniref:Uncharacterized protein n=1 Tax=Panagrolaimus davidi TaxID=227884 RepID=A0A914R4I1_9BILA
MSDVKNNFSNQLVLIKEENDVLKGIIVDYKNGKILSTTTLDCKKFLDKDIPYVFSRRVKAVFLYIPELIPPDFSSNYEFRKTLKSKFDAAKISYYFFNEFQWNFTNMLISVEFCASKNDDILLLIEIYDNEFISIEQKDGGTPKILESWLPEQNCHQHEITLSIDLNGFIDFSTKAIVWSNVKTLPKLLIENDFKVPVISFSENLSFICVYKNGKYDIMDLYISFDEEKPKYCQNALESVRTKPTFVVHNIFEIMSKSPENVPECAFHDFKITKDEENPVLAVPYSRLWRHLNF